MNYYCSSFHITMGCVAYITYNALQQALYWILLSVEARCYSIHLVCFNFSVSWLLTVFYLINC